MSYKNKIILLFTLFELSSVIFFSAVPLRGEDSIYRQNELNISLDIKNALSDYKSAAQTALYAGSLEIALKFGKKSLETKADDTATVLIVAQSLLWTSKADEAEKYYKKYFKLKGTKTASIYYQFAECLNSSGKADKALHYFNEAMKLAGTDETELKGNINIAKGYYYLEKNDFIKAKNYFYSALKYDLKAKYLEAMGDYHVKLAAVQIPEIYFDIETKTIIKKYSDKDTRRAYDYYKRSLNEKPDNKYIKIKISDARWALGKKKQAVSLMRAAADETLSNYAFSRLSYFLKEENKTNETELKNCIKLLERAIALDGPESDLEYEKAEIYYLLKNDEAYFTALKKAAKSCTGKEWFAYYLTSKLIAASNGASEDDYKSVMNICMKLCNTPGKKAAAEAAYAAAAIKFSKDCAPIHINNFINEKIEVSEGYDYYATALTAFNALNYEIRLKYASLEKAINGALQNNFIKDTREKLKYVEKYIGDETSEAKLLNLYDIKTEFCLSIGENETAYETAMKKSNLVSNDAVKYAKELKKAFTFAQYCSKTDEALIIAKKIFKMNAADMEHLSLIIYSEYWGGEREIAESCLRELKKIDEKSYIALTFEGLKLEEKNKNRSALNKFKEALSGGGDVAYLTERIEQTLKKLKTVMNTGYTFTNDSSGQKLIEKNLYFDIYGDGTTFIAGINMAKENKQQMFTEAVPLSTDIYDYFAGASYDAGKKGIFGLKLHYSSALSSFNNDKSNFFPELTFTKNYTSSSLTLNYSEGYMRDTPLAGELGLKRKNFKINYGFYGDKFYYSIENNLQKLSDSNSRLTLSIGAGYKVYHNLSLKLQAGYDKMKHEYSGATTIGNRNFMPYEVYYSPDGVFSRGAGLEYGLNYKNTVISLSTILYGKETRNNGPDSKYNNLSLGLNRPFDETHGMSLNLYGSKSEVNPFSDQSVKSIYIGRELYLKYYIKL